MSRRHRAYVYHYNLAEIECNEEELRYKWSMRVTEETWYATEYREQMNHYHESRESFHEKLQESQRVSLQILSVEEVDQESWNHHWESIENQDAKQSKSRIQVVHDNFTR